MRHAATFCTNTGEGVLVTWDAHGATIEIGGWYDTHTGIAPHRLPLAEFLRRLGITEADCRRAFVVNQPDRPTTARGEG